MIVVGGSIVYSLVGLLHMCVDIRVNVKIVTGGVLDDDGSSFFLLS